MGIEGPKLVDTIALTQLAFSFATFAFFAAKTPESIKVVWRRVGRRFLHDLHGYNLCRAAKRLFPGGRRNWRDVAVNMSRNL